MNQFLKNKWIIVSFLVIISIIGYDFYKGFNKISSIFYDTHAVITDSDSKSYLFYDRYDKSLLSIMEMNDHVKYVSKTSFHCDKNQATVVSLSIYDNNDVLIDHQDIENLFDIENDSISEVEYEYVCKFLVK